MADDGALILQPELADELRGAALSWGYDSPEELVRHAFAELRRWREPPMPQEQLRALIQEGLDDIAAGRVYDFDAEEIIREAKERRAGRCG